MFLLWIDYLMYDEVTKLPFPSAIPYGHICTLIAAVKRSLLCRSGTIVYTYR